MKTQIPNSPFTTRLSGSAKETELRLRSIFQWKKKRPPMVLFVLTAILVLLCFGLVSCESAEVPEELMDNIEQWIAEYPWAEENSLVDEETRWTIESIELGKGRTYDTGDIYDVDCISQDGMWCLRANLLVDPDTLEVLDIEGYTIESSPDRPTVPPWESPKEDSAEVAPISGTALSPDGSYEVRLTGSVKGISTDDLTAAEFVQICDAQTGEVLWEDAGAYEHAVVWSPDGKKLALARTTRTGSTVTIVETESWTAWDVTIPGKDSWDQISIPEYTYLPDNGDWFEWFQSETFRLTLGRGGDAGNRNDYYGSIYKGVPLDGKTLYLEEESLPSEYDLNHDGSPERLEKLTIQETADGVVHFFLLRVLDEDGTCLWAGDAGSAHAAWNTYFACTLDGQDYLLQYMPYMSGGVGYYFYRLFYLSPEGEEILYQEKTLDFDINPTAKFVNHNFDADAIADFVDEVNELLAHSKLLLTTDDAVRDMDPDAPVETLWWLSNDLGYGYDENKSMRENLEAMEAFLASI